jgi:DNA-binding PadR family transcriptional regulator
MDVKTLCLGVLTEGDKTGYEIKQCFEEAFRHFFAAGFGSIYPALAELTRRGLVSCTSVEQEKRPDKKVYRITPAGRAVLVAELMATPPRHKVRSEFLSLMYFAHLLPPDRVAEVIDQMIAQWDAMLGHIEACAAADSVAGQPLAPGMRFTAGYGRAVIGAARHYVESHKRQIIEHLEEQAAGQADAAE